MTSAAPESGASAARTGPETSFGRGLRPLGRATPGTLPVVRPQLHQKGSDLVFLLDPLRLMVLLDAFWRGTS